MQAASVLTKTFEEKKKDANELKIEGANKILAEMDELRFEIFSDYLEYLKQQENMPKSKENEAQAE